MSHEVIMPALGMAQDTGLLVAWHKQPGEAVKIGDVLMDVETDKSTMEVEAQADGYLCDVRAVAGEDVPVGKVIATITALKQSDAVVAASAAPVADVVAADAAVALTPGVAAPPAVQSVAINPADAGGRILASPKARRLAHEAGLDLSALLQAGLPQPYRAKDVETLRTLSVPVPFPVQIAAPIGEDAALSLAASVSHIAARVPRIAFDAFVQQMADEGQVALEVHVIWAFFAARAARPALGSDTLTIAVQDRTGGAIMALVDPDLSRLSAPRTGPKTGPTDAAAMLTLRDLTGSAIIGLSLSTDGVPAFSVNATGTTFEIGFAFSETRISAPDALQIVSVFADQLENPLRHLV